MLQIAGEYTNAQRRTDYVKAVEKFRLPYWDYHQPRDYGAKFPGVIENDGTMTSYPYDFGVPQIFTLKTIKVRTSPNDKLEPIENPLYSFSFPKPRKDGTESMTADDWKASGLKVR